MTRWEPNARGRLEQAALELYLEQGFEATTVAQIAERAGLTERTFFRYFADKREVLFGRSADLEQAMVNAALDAPADATPLQAVAASLDAAADLLQDRRAHSKRRQSVIDANPALQERDLMKMARLSAALAGALRQRGIDASTATLAAETGIAVFKVAFERWVGTSWRGRFADLMRETLAGLQALSAANG